MYIVRLFMFVYFITTRKLFAAAYTYVLSILCVNG